MHPCTVGKTGETDEALSRAVRLSLGSLHLTCLHVRATSCLPESRTHHGQATAVLLPTAGPADPGVPGSPQVPFGNASPIPCPSSHSPSVSSPVSPPWVSAYAQDSSLMRLILDKMLSLPEPQTRMLWGSRCLLSEPLGGGASQFKDFKHQVILMMRQSKQGLLC